MFDTATAVNFLTNNTDFCIVPTSTGNTFDHYLKYNIIAQYMIIIVINMKSYEAEQLHVSQVV